MSIIYINNTGLARAWARIKAWVQGAFVPVTRKVNNKALSADISLNAADVGADVLIYTIDASGIFQTGTKNIQGSEAYNAILAAYNAGKSVFIKLDGEEFKPILPLNTILQYTGGTIHNFIFTVSVSTPSGTIAYIDAQIFPNYSLLTYSFGYNVMGNDTIRNVISISEAAYNALATKDSSTLYVITEQ